jgi:transcriptional regulator with XRE-family HTH domain
MKLSKLIGVAQSGINGYEHGKTSVPSTVLLKYSEFFDVSLDWMFGRTDNPEGALFNRQPKLLTDKFADQGEWTKFVEMCFNPASPMSAKLKEMIIAMAGGEQL